MAKAYETKAAEFKKVYGIDLDIGAHYDFHKSLNTFDAFKFNTNVDEATRNLYVDTLVDALSVRLENISKIGEGRFYKSVNASIGEFIEDFDKLMQVKFAEDAAEQRIPNTHKPLEGFTYSGIAKLVIGRLKKYDKPVPDVWADSMIKGNMTLDDIKAVVDPAKTRLNDSLGEEWGSSEKSDYINTLMAKKALDKAIAGRSFWWKLWAGNWRTMYRESQYSKELEKDLVSFTLLNNGLEETELGELTEKSMLNDAKNKLNEFLKMKAAANEQAPKTAEVFYDNGLDERENVIATLDDETIEAYLDNEAIEEDKYYDEVARKKERERIKKERERIKKETVVKDVMKSVDNLAEARSAIMKKEVSEIMQEGIVSLMENCTSEYGDRAAKAKTIYTSLGMRLIETWRDKMTMGTIAVDMFKAAYNALKDGTPGMSVVNKLVAAQKMTDFMLNFLSPAVKNAKLQEYCDNYALGELNNEDIKKLTGYEGNVTELINSARDELGMGKVQLEDESAKEKMEIPELSSKDENKEASPKIEEINTVSKEKSIN